MALTLLLAVATGCGPDRHRPLTDRPLAGAPTIESVASRYSTPDRDMTAVDRVRVYRLTWHQYLIDAQGTPVAPGGLYTSATPDKLRAAGAQVPHPEQVVYLVAQHGTWIPPLTHGTPYRWRFVTVTDASAELHISGAISDEVPAFLSRFRDARVFDRPT